MTTTSRPRAEQIVEALDWIMDQIEMLVQEREEKRMNAAEAARALGYGPRYFHGHPWRIPSFGLNGFQHPLSTWREWNERPEIDRRAEWDAMSLKERSRARGIPA